MFALSDKKYESVHEESARKDIFIGNLKRIEMHNYLHDKGVKSYRLGVNEYADMVCIHYSNRIWISNELKLY